MLASSPMHLTKRSSHALSTDVNVALLSNLSTMIAARRYVCFVLSFFSAAYLRMQSTSVCLDFGSLPVMRVRNPSFRRSYSMPSCSRRNLSMPSMIRTSRFVFAFEFGSFCANETPLNGYFAMIPVLTANSFRESRKMTDTGISPFSFRLLSLVLIKYLIIMLVLFESHSKSPPKSSPNTTPKPLKAHFLCILLVVNTTPCVRSVFA